MATSGKDTGIVGYNVQIAVDTQHHLIVAHDVTNVGSDRHQLVNMAEQARAEMAVETLNAVQRTGDHVRVNVSLTDLSTGAGFWSDRFDGDQSNLAGLQDQIVVRLARSLSVELIEAESRRGQSERSNNPDAVDLAMLGWIKFYEPRTQANIQQAGEWFDSAFRLDPDNVDAMIGKSWCLSINVLYYWSASSDSDLRLATEFIDRAFAKRPPSALAHLVRGGVLRFGHPEAALAEYEAALEIDPNYPPAYFYKGIELTELGRAREAITAHQIALRLSPKDPLAPNMHYGLCHAHLHIREYAEAIDECRRSVRLNETWCAYVDLVVAYEAMGQPEQSRLARGAMNAVLRKRRRMDSRRTADHGSDSRIPPIRAFF
jgi:tetratricopeptide (TPR) repeat protein